MVFSKFAKTLTAQFPVIGPHADIEGKLLLAGQKPVGWIEIFSDDYYPMDHEFAPEVSETAQAERRETLQKIRDDIDIRRALDAAVGRGELKSVDVFTSLPDTGERIATTRCYCKPGHEEAMKKMADHMQSFNDGKPDLDAANSIAWGQELGYRKRDIMLWNLVNGPHGRFLGDKNIDRLYALSEKTKPDYQARAVAKAEKIIAHKNVPPKIG